MLPNDCSSQLLGTLSYLMPSYRKTAHVSNQLLCFWVFRQTLWSYWCVNRSTSNYTPQYKLSTKYFHMLYVHCILGKNAAVSYLRWQVSTEKHFKKGNLLSQMRWKMSILMGAWERFEYWKGKTGFKLISHHLNYSHFSTEKLIILHKEWMWYASHNTFCSNEYFMMPGKKVSVLD